MYLIVYKPLAKIMSVLLVRYELKAIDQWLDDVGLLDRVP